MFGSAKSIALGLLAVVGMTTAVPQNASAGIVHFETYVVRLQNPSTSLNCRADSNTSSRIVTTFKEGTVLSLNSEKEGIFHQVSNSSGEDCYVSQDFVKPLDTSSITGLFKEGTYQVTATDLNVRAYPSTSAPIVGKRLQRGTDITVVGLGVDKTNQSWLRLSNGGFVVGNPGYYIFKGSGDPTCNHFIQACP